VRAVDLDNNSPQIALRNHEEVFLILPGDINTPGGFTTLPAYDIVGREVYLALRTTF